MGNLPGAKEFGKKHSEMRRAAKEESEWEAGNNAGAIPRIILPSNPLGECLEKNPLP